MEKYEFIEKELGITHPWSITKIELKDEGTENEAYNLSISFQRGHVFKEGWKTHDTRIRTLRDAELFGKPCYLKVKVPRIKNTEGKINMIELLWANPLSRHTYRFEERALELASKEMSVAEAARILKVSPDIVHGIIRKSQKKSPTG